MTTSDFEKMARRLCEDAPGNMCDNIAEQLRQVWNLRGAADIAAIDEVAHTNETAVEAAIERLDLA